MYNPPWTTSKNPKNIPWNASQSLVPYFVNRVTSIQHGHVNCASVLIKHIILLKLEQWPCFEKDIIINIKVITNVGLLACC